MTDADVLAILGKMVKQRHESARAYEEGGRLDLAERERAEVEVLEDFLPKQLDEDEVAAAIAAAVAATEATSIRDMGRVMAVLKAKYTGQMDFGRVGPMVKDQAGVEGLTGRSFAHSGGLAAFSRATRRLSSGRRSVSVRWCCCGCGFRPASG